MTEFYQWAASQPVFVQVALGLALFLLGLVVLAALIAIVAVVLSDLSAGDPANATAPRPDPAKDRKQLRWGVGFWGVILLAVVVAVVIQALQSRG